MPDTDTDINSDTNTPAEELPGDWIADDLETLAAVTADDARVFLATMTRIAAGESPASALSLSLLGLSQILVTGARLGAVEDVVPAERFEPDDGPDTDLSGLRAGLANTFEGLDDYADLVDPVTSTDVTSGACECCTACSPTSASTPTTTSSPKPSSTPCIPEHPRRARARGD